MKKGFVHLYTGDGKGKTTAALGLALRAAGAGLKVHIIQFAKGKPSSELKALKQVRNISVRRFGSNQLIIGKPSKKDLLEAYHALMHAGRILSSNKYDMLILDELAIAVHLKLVSINDVLSLIQAKPAGIELVITGRNAPKDLIDAADLVTEMKEIKHYFHAGVSARIGIEK